MQPRTEERLTDVFNLIMLALFIFAGVLFFFCMWQAASIAGNDVWGERALVALAGALTSGWLVANT